jgi:hypothetical protein
VLGREMRSVIDGMGWLIVRHVSLFKVGDSLRESLSAARLSLCRSPRD